MEGLRDMVAVQHRNREKFTEKYLRQLRQKSLYLKSYYLTRPVQSSWIQINSRFSL